MHWQRTLSLTQLACRKTATSALVFSQSDEREHESHIIRDVGIASLSSNCVCSIVFLFTSPKTNDVHLNKKNKICVVLE